MKDRRDSLAALIEMQIQKGSPYLDLVLARSEQEFDAAFWAILEEKLTHLEKNRKLFGGHSEDQLTAVLVGALNFLGLRTTSQEYSNGLVDITSVGGCTPRRIKLGEAKIYAGPANHMRGIDQLLTRYTTGRETTGYLLSYVRHGNIKKITLRLRAKLNERKPVQQIGNCEDHTLKWSFTTKHDHISGERLSLAHVGCNLYVEKG